MNFLNLIKPFSSISNPQKVQHNYYDLLELFFNITVLHMTNVIVNVMETAVCIKACHADCLGWRMCITTYGSIKMITLASLNRLMSKLVLYK